MSAVSVHVSGICSWHPQSIVTTMDTKLEELSPFPDVDEDEDELEENEIVLEDC